jgi:hypothetical protein
MLLLLLIEVSGERVVRGKWLAGRCPAACDKCINRNFDW